MAAEFEFNIMHKKFFALLLAFFMFCFSFGNPTPVEKLCNVKIKSVEVAPSRDCASIKVALKNFSGESRIVDLSYIVFEISPSQKTLAESLKALRVELGAGEEKSVDIATQKMREPFSPQGVFRTDVILTYKPEVFIGFFNNDKIIDEKRVVFSLQGGEEKKK